VPVALLPVAAAARYSLSGRSELGRGARDAEHAHTVMLPPGAGQLVLTLAVAVAAKIARASIRDIGRRGIATTYSYSRSASCCPSRLREVASSECCLVDCRGVPPACVAVPCNASARRLEASWVRGLDRFGGKTEAVRFQMPSETGRGPVAHVRVRNGL
jgi:hypothetical protein